MRSAVGVSLESPIEVGRGWLSPSRTAVLVAFQRAGESASGHGEGWKAVHVDELQLDEVEVLDVPFVVNQGGYREGGYSKNLEEVHCCV